jgi:adenylate cyclase
LPARGSTTRPEARSAWAIVGNFGGEQLFDYTAYGDTINAAARLEAANKVFGARICVSAAAVARTKGFVGRPIGDLALRGRSELLRAYEPLRDPPPDPDDCAAAFAALVGARPHDPLAQYHLRRLLNGGSGIRLDLRVCPESDL